MLALYANMTADQFVSGLRKDGIEETFRFYKRHAYKYGYPSGYYKHDGIYFFTYECPVDGTHPVIYEQLEFSYNTKEDMARVIISIPALELKSVALRGNIF